MSRKYRLILLVLAGFSLLFIGVISTNDAWTGLFQSTWFSFGVLLLILSLIDQPYFSSIPNIFLNSTAAGLLLLSIDNIDWVLFIFIIGVAYLFFFSYVLLFSGKYTEENKSLKPLIKNIQTLGNPRFLFLVLFFWTTHKYFYATDPHSMFMLWIWAIVFIIFQCNVIAQFIQDHVPYLKNTTQEIGLGKIIGVQSKNTFLVKLHPQNSATKVNLFDFVEFKYSVDKGIKRGLIFDDYLLNQERWIKVLNDKEIDNIFKETKKQSSHILDVVYTPISTPENDYIERFVGIVTDNSKINKIRFNYCSDVPANADDLLNANDLLEVYISSSKVLYQVIEGITKIEGLEKKNQTGLIIGEAIQLGTWNKETAGFDQFGWLPEINSPVFISSPLKEEEQPSLAENKVKIGKIPNTEYPVILNKEISLTHHTAVLGVTGTGKSVFARNLIRQHLKDENVKEICIDFIGEYKNKFNDLKPVDILSNNSAKFYENFNKISDIELLTPGEQKKKNDDLTESIERNEYIIETAISNFLKDKDEKISIIEPPNKDDLSALLYFTNLLCEGLLNIAREKSLFEKRVCVVLEEAHIIIPERNLASAQGSKEKKPSISNIVQIALLGRKHNIGLLVIAQRTASVSKAILSQVNSIITFKMFDKTGFDFLESYFGPGISSSIRNLKRRQAIATGAAFKSSVPVTFEVPDVTKLPSKKTSTSDTSSPTKEGASEPKS